MSATVEDIADSIMDEWVERADGIADDVHTAAQIGAERIHALLNPGLDIPEPECLHGEGSVT